MFASNLEPWLTDPRARQLYERVKQLGVSFGLERSFRMSPGKILHHRFLLSLSKGSLGPTPLRMFVSLARQIATPEALLHEMARIFDLADFVHLGFEQNVGTSLYKIYLESHVPAARGDLNAPIVLHRAYKWDPAEPSRHAFTEYTWHPGLSIDGIRERVKALYRAADADESRDLALAVIERAGEQTTQGEVRYLEVTEDRNPRRSFDVNLYDARLTLADIRAWLARVGAHFALPGDPFGLLLESCASKAVGHLAGGVHRGGEDFLTVYYGVEER
jgi:hypothetical protein